MIRCHVWFSTKRRKRLLQGDVGDLAERAMREVATTDGIRLLECKAAIDHVHIVVELESTQELPAVMKALKGKSARLVFQQFSSLKLDAGTNHLWQRGYGWRPIGSSDEKRVRRYVRTQMDRLERFSR